MTRPENQPENSRQPTETSPAESLTRRDLLKGAAVAGAAVAAAGALAAASPVVAAGGSANPEAKMPMPWWVRRIDKPKYEINEEYGPFNQRNTAFGRLADYIGKDLNDQLSQTEKEVRLQGVKENIPGNSLRDRALGQGSNTVRNSIAARTLYSWTPILAKSPQEEWGVEAWQGSTEEAAVMVKAAARHYGASDVGIAVLDRRHLYSHEGGKPILFEDVEAPYIDEKKKVIPESCKWVISLVITQSRQLIARAPSALGSAGTGLGYSHMPVVAGSLAEFIRSLGYNAIAAGNDLGQSVPMAIDAGLGELSRTGRMIHPSFGMNIRLCKVVTDLPMTPDKPIDFGVMEFCKTCKRCAEACPGGAISMETEPFWQTLGEWNQPGKKVWHEDAAKCLSTWRKLGTGCSICVRVCPYTKGSDTLMHDMVKATSAKTTALNSLFVRSDEIFGYGAEQDQDEWWHLDESPHGWDPNKI